MRPTAKSDKFLKKHCRSCENSKNQIETKRTRCSLPFLSSVYVYVLHHNRSITCVTHSTWCWYSAERNSNEQSRSDLNTARENVYRMYLRSAMHKAWPCVHYLLLLLFLRIYCCLLCIALLMLIIETSNFKGPQNEFIVHVSPPRMCSTHTHIHTNTTRDTRNSKNRTRQGTTLQWVSLTRTQGESSPVYKKKATSKFSNCMVFFLFWCLAQYMIGSVMLT